MFRVLFGFMMLVSIIRFAVRGWIYELYVEPTFFFTYYGFDWVKPLGEIGMYVVFGAMGVSALLIMAGWHYRIAASLFFVLFTYVELIDKTNYLNHYYFVSIISFLLILVPANRYFSIDAWRIPAFERQLVPAWTINIFKLQLGLVYVFAGIAKLNPDWLFNAMPLRLWLPSFGHLPVIGAIFQQPETAFAFSWAGAIYDLFIVFFLLYGRTRVWAYIAVLAFHMMTALLFQIGMFPYIMMLCTLIYFSPAFHERMIAGMRKALANVGIGVNRSTQRAAQSAYVFSRPAARAVALLLTIHFTLQFLLPFRYVLYPDTLYWTEQGYRFSWRVMLMEKAGYTAFRIHDNASGRSWEAANWEYLTPTQEKMMATQPDMILQFAHHLQEEYAKEGYHDISITVDSYVTLNGRRSRRFINANVDLTKQRRSLAHKSWVLPFTE